MGDSNNDNVRAPVATGFFQESLDRYRGRGVNTFEKSGLGARTVAVADTMKTYQRTPALDSQRTYDVGAISAAVAIPLLASLIYGIASIRVYAHKDNADLQAIVAAAFTVSSYISHISSLQVELKISHGFTRTWYLMVKTVIDRGFDTCSHCFFRPGKGRGRRHD